MNFKTTAVLLLMLMLVGGYAYLYGRPAPPPPQEKPPFVYSVDIEDIVRMEVVHDNQKLELKWDEGGSKWVFADPSKGEVDQGRVNGVRLLLTGPGSKRVLFREKVSDFSQYGLEKARTIATVELKNGSIYTVLIGDRTPSGDSYYIRNKDDDQIYLVDFTWGNEIARFVTEPPIAKDQPQGSTSRMTLLG